MRNPRPVTEGKNSENPYDPLKALATKAYGDAARGYRDKRRAKNRIARKSRRAGRR